MTDAPMLGSHWSMRLSRCFIAARGWDALAGLVKNSLQSLLRGLDDHQIVHGFSTDV